MYKYTVGRGLGFEGKLHNCIFRILCICVQAVDTHYSFARRDVALRIVFKQSEISLDIPKKGRLINKGWKILPRTYPSVSYVIYTSISLIALGWRYFWPCQLIKAVFCFGAFTDIYSY